VRELTVGFPVLERPSYPLPHLEGHWLISAREFLFFINGALEITDLTIHPMQQNGDFYLMEKTVESQRFTPAETNRVNLCRLYLGATTVSDISNANGSISADIGIRSLTDNGRKTSLSQVEINTHFT
jgi:hypothetical protein